ncbi:MAG: DUF1801 domain-containing protein, partial [Bacteroidota bacterium]|nr:DUF1801 domain-containing protein [Bacteroidota bacterium]MDX5430274.1 DUF1801 domain-containing protein [Bacteroidota bacterium]MDX5469035.1 DUF1801 domain-containing protein [Bacteroidota bacterium]
VPDVKEKLSYQVPYFRRYKNFCFIWPGSILWGKNRLYEGVRFGFIHGNLLSDPEGKLNLGERKSVAYQDFTDIRQVDWQQMESWIYESVLLDEEKHRQKK